MDMFDGFVFLEEKKKSLIPILCQYDFLSALTAAFSITSWRKNRGAQESCLALNSAMVENTEWGRKTIFTPNDLEEFFQLLYPILKTTPYDDPVLPDFGEIKLNYRSKYYSVITGTGHTAPIFSALQFLEKISESACMDAYTDSLLCYSDYCIDFLKAKNTPINEDFSLHPQFESPTFDYYENVKDFNYPQNRSDLNVDFAAILLLFLENIIFLLIQLFIALVEFLALFLLLYFFSFKRSNLFAKLLTPCSQLGPNCVNVTLPGTQIAK